VCNIHEKASPLIFAILKQNYEGCKVLLDYGANPNAKDTGGNTPMHLAVVK